MSKYHAVSSGMVTRQALPAITRQRGTTTGAANLMLYGAGKTTVSNNTTFVDSSANAFTVTRNGDTVQSGFNPFSQASAGAGYFDGTGDYLSVPDNAAFTFDGDFTIEAWVYKSSGVGTVAAHWPGFVATNCSWIVSTDANNRLTFSYGIGSTNATITGTSTTVTANQWNHVAVSRSGTTVRLFVNGVQDATTGTVSGTLNNSTGIITVGVINTNDGQYLTGYISNLRVVKGTAVYTSNFTPPTSPLTAITNTSLLLLTDNYSIVNSTSTNLPVTINGNTTISTAQFPTGMSSSIYFDGTGDYLTTPSNAVFSYPAEFTLEMWIYPITQLTISGGSTTVLFFVNGTNGLQVGAQSATAWGLANRSVGWRLTTATFPTLNAWNHIAITRNSSNNTAIFLNGTRVANGTVTDSFGAGLVYVGFASAFALAYNGYLSNLRIAKGTAIYDPTLTTLTVPTPPLSTTVTVPNFVTNNIYGVNQIP